MRHKGFEMSSGEKRGGSAPAGRLWFLGGIDKVRAAAVAGDPYPVPLILQEVFRLLGLVLAPGSFGVDAGESDPVK
ncbi:MAG: hypothetical protein WC262_11100 [Bacteroidales bacterium]